MKRLILCLALVAALAAGCIGGESEDTELTIYTYDSFVSEWGPGPVVIPLFEELYGVTVHVVSLGSSGDVLSRAILERDDPKADILLGVNDLQMYTAFEHGLLQAYEPEESGMIAPDLVMDDQWRITPFDYGHMALIYDSDVVPDPPSSFEDLLDPQWEGKLIVEDPRTSSPGLSFLLWTVAAYGDGFAQYWEGLDSTILTIAPSWSTAYYGMFLEGEAPMVISYSTSPAYHLAFEGTDRYRGIIFEEGGFLQIEGAGVVNGAPHKELAEKFIDFMISEAFQQELALTQFMMPVNPSVELPDSYSIVETTDDILPLDRASLGESIDGWLLEWEEAIR
jgi:thiamine transport system substrate-binding protein